MCVCWMCAILSTANLWAILFISIEPHSLIINIKTRLLHALLFITFWQQFLTNNIQWDTVVWQLDQYIFGDLTPLSVQANSYEVFHLDRALTSECTKGLVSPQATELCSSKHWMEVRAYLSQCTFSSHVLCFLYCQKHIHQIMCWLITAF